MRKFNSPLIPPFTDAEAPGILWQLILKDNPDFSAPHCTDQILVLVDGTVKRMEEFADSLELVSQVDVVVLSPTRSPLHRSHAESSRIVVGLRQHVMTGFRLPNLRMLVILGDQRGLDRTILMQAATRGGYGTTLPLMRTTQPKRWRELGLDAPFVATVGDNDRLAHWYSTDPHKIMTEYKAKEFKPKEDAKKKPDALEHPLRKVLVPLYEDLTSTDVMPIVQATYQPDLEEWDWDFLDRINVEGYSTYVLIAVIRSLYSYRSELPSWYVLRDKIYDHFNNTGLNADRLMRGLFND